MSEYVFKLPDLGEGTVEAEIVEWHVQVGDEVREGDVIVDVMTDKANVEVPAPVDGKVLRTSGQPGDIVAVGSELIALESAAPAPRRRIRETPPAAPAAAAEVEQAPEPEAEPEPGSGSETGPGTESEAGTGPEPQIQQPPKPAEPPPPKPAPAAPDATAPEPPATARARVLTSPAIRRRAKEAGIDLHDVPGTGPRGRITRSDFDAYAAEERSTDRAPAPPERVSAHRASAEAPSGSEFDEVKVVGVRRVIAERMSQSKREIPHFTYVEEVDVTELETLRRHLNEVHQRRLTVLPFIAMALMRVLPDFPQCNARYDAQNNVVQRYRPVHLGIATQTPDGLKVPVVRQAQGLDLWRLADEIGRVAEAAREGSARREELSGSTITITSLGRLGGVVTTPVINYPEMGIIGVNRAVERPVVLDGAVRVRTMMNLSSSFDHRFVDGYDAAAMIQQAKDLLEHPAALFVPPP